MLRDAGNRGSFHPVLPQDFSRCFLQLAERFAAALLLGGECLFCHEEYLYQSTKIVLDIYVNVNLHLHLEKRSW